MEFFEKNYRKILIGILFGTFFISLVHSFYYRILPAVDADTYDYIAQQIVAGHGFRMDLDGPIERDRAVTRVGPGYEFFLAIVYSLFGRHFWIVWIFQALMHAATAWLVFSVSRHVFREYWTPLVGLVAVALIAFSPDLLIGTSMLLAETLGIFLMLCFVWSAFRYSDEPGPMNAGYAGLLLGLALLVRTPIGALLLPVAGFFLWRRKFSHLIIFLAMAAAILTPWTVRNYMVYGTFIPTNLAYGGDFLAGNNPKATGELDESRYEYDPSYATYGIVGAQKEALQKTVSYVLEHPFHFVKLTLYRVSIYFSFARPTGWWPYLESLPVDRMIVVFSSALYSVILFSLGVAGVRRALRDAGGETRTRTLLLAGMLISMPLAIIFIIVETRYRYPVYPFMALFAGYEISVLLKNRSIFERALLIAFAVLSANTLFDVLRNVQRILEKLHS